MRKAFRKPTDQLFLPAVRIVRADTVFPERQRRIKHRGETKPHAMQHLVSMHHANPPDVGFEYDEPKFFLIHVIYFFVFAASIFFRTKAFDDEALSVGLCQYLTDGSSLDKARELARTAAENPPLSNFAICSGISHMQNMSGLDAAYAEAVLAGVVNTQPASKDRLEAFANKTAARVRPT